MPASANGDDLEDGFQIQADFSEVEEKVEAVVQALTRKKKRKRNTASKEKAAKVRLIDSGIRN
jgi:hypothetical protein